jgi:ribokinase
VDVIDSTGAGDSFDAGFLAGMLLQWPPERSLRLAVACGSLAVRGIGGTGSQPTLEEALAAIDEPADAAAATRRGLGDGFEAAEPESPA